MVQPPCSRAPHHPLTTVCEAPDRYAGRGCSICDWVWSCARAEPGSGWHRATPGGEWERSKRDGPGVRAAPASGSGAPWARPARAPPRTRAGNCSTACAHAMTRGCDTPEMSPQHSLWGTTGMRPAGRPEGLPHSCGPWQCCSGCAAQARTQLVWRCRPSRSPDSPLASSCSQGSGTGHFAGTETQPRSRPAPHEPCPAEAVTPRRRARTASRWSVARSQPASAPGSAPLHRRMRCATAYRSWSRPSPLRPRCARAVSVPSSAVGPSPRVAAAPASSASPWWQPCRRSGPAFSTAGSRVVPAEKNGRSLSSC
eukprot:scaffold21070_cov107-Isochrysis_galbana.AAC.2